MRAVIRCQPRRVLPSSTCRTCADRSILLTLLAAGCVRSEGQPPSNRRECQEGGELLWEPTSSHPRSMPTGRRRASTLARKTAVSGDCRLHHSPRAHRRLARTVDRVTGVPQHALRARRRQLHERTERDGREHCVAPANAPAAGAATSAPEPPGCPGAHAPPTGRRVGLERHRFGRATRIGGMKPTPYESESTVSSRCPARCSQLTA